MTWVVALLTPPPEAGRLSSAWLAAANKDFWDKLSAVSTFVGGVLVTGSIAIATLVYNRRQSEADMYQRTQDRMINRIKAIGELIPRLSSGDPRQIEAALVIIAEFGEEELSRRLALIYQSEGGFGALERLAASTPPGEPSPAATSLNQILAGLANSVVRIRSTLSDREWWGVGFFASPNLILTPFYMVGSGETTKIEVFNKANELIPVEEIVRLGDEHDPVAVLRVAASARPLPFSSGDEANLGADAYVLAYDSGRPDLVAEQCRIDGVRIDGSIILGGVVGGRGFGGAPVVGRSGSVVGMIYRSIDAPTRLEALSVEQLRAALGNMN